MFHHSRKIALARLIVVSELIKLKQYPKYSQAEDAQSIRCIQKIPPKSNKKKHPFMDTRRKRYGSTTTDVKTHHVERISQFPGKPND